MEDAQLLLLRAAEGGNMKGITILILIMCIGIYAVEFFYQSRILDELRTIKRYLRKMVKEETE